MFYLYGKKLQENQKLETALKRIQGIGKYKASEICAELGLGSNFKVSNLTESNFIKIQKKIEKNHLVEGNLRKGLQIAIQRFQYIGSYRGFRHNLSLPVRGQRTRSNGRTQKRIGKRFQR